MDFLPGKGFPWCDPFGGTTEMGIFGSSMLSTSCSAFAGSGALCGSEDEVVDGI